MACPEQEVLKLTQPVIYLYADLEELLSRKKWGWLQISKPYPASAT